ncbi:MAG: FecR domain-containing protein [Opitutales bacterium]
MKPFRFLLFCFAFCGVGLTSLMAQDSLQQGTVKAFMVRGEVRLVNNATGRSTPLMRGQEFPDGFTVVTSRGSTALLLFSNGASINLGPDSRLNVSEFLQQSYNPSLGSYATLDADPSLSRTELRLDYGELTGEVRELREESNFDVNTPTGAAGIRGTLFTVTHDTVSGVTTVTNIRGGVTVTFQGDVFNLAPMQTAVLQGTITEEMSLEDMVEAASQSEAEDAERALAVARAAGIAGQEAEREAMDIEGLSDEAAAEVGDHAAESAFVAGASSGRIDGPALEDIARDVASGIVVVARGAVDAAGNQNLSGTQVDRAVTGATNAAGRSFSQSVQTNPELATASLAFFGDSENQNVFIDQGLDNAQGPAGGAQPGAQNVGGADELDEETNPNVGDPVTDFEGEED